MTQQRPGKPRPMPWPRRLAVLCLAAGLAACGRTGLGPETGDGGLRLRFEDRPEPEVFIREGPAVRTADDGAAGLWAAVRGLPRAERGLAVNPANRRSVVVALFPTRPRDPDIRLSAEAADALGLGAGPTPVRITALRRELELDTK